MKQYLGVEKHAGMDLTLNSSSFCWLPQMMAYST